MKLLNSGNSKTSKGEKKGWMTFGTHLAPSKESGYNTCAWSSDGCSAACLNTAGRGAMSSVQNARKSKTVFFFENRQEYMTQLFKEIKSAIRKAKKNNMKPCFRLNLTSDLPWEKIKNKETGTTVFEEFPDVQFYDYCKDPNRAIAFLNGKMPKNYHLTFSRSEVNHSTAMAILKMGGNVAIVFDQLVKKYEGFDVIDGDDTDLRFLDKKGCIVGLVAKGRAKKDTSGFVVLTQS